MSHLAYQPRGKNVVLDADFVVVGSGAGGAAAAATLARSGAHVVVVEAGPWRDPEHYPSTCYGAMRDLFDNWGVQVAVGRALWPVVQARCVGGTTVINSAICVRTPEDIFDLWEREHGIDVAPMREAIWRHQDDLEIELSAEPVPAASAGRSNRLAVVAADRLNIPGAHVMTRYSKGCEGSGQCLQGCRKRTKQSTNVTMIPEVQRRGGFVLSSAPVHKVLFKGTRAAGVTGRFVHPQSRKTGAKFTVHARRGVIIAASSTHTPVILRRSGLRQRPIGKYFRSHPGTGVFGVYKDPVDMNLGTTQGWSALGYREKPGIKLETLSIPPEMVASRLTGAGATLMRKLSEYRHLAMWVHSIRAESTGAVHTVMGKPFIRYGFDKPDLHRLRLGMHTVAKMHLAAGAESVIPGIYGLPYKLEAHNVDLIKQAPLDPRQYIAILSHLFGGAVMGADERRAVCDSAGRVYGVQGLAVADAAVLPTVLGVNPQHTIMAMARYVAERQLDG
jgi:choline dehydrogenase-like flavoprotein